MRKNRSIFIKSIFLCLFLLSPVFAETMSEEEVQAKVREISKTLRCAVCQSESVWESGAELAMQMREIVRERVIAGESGDEIRAYFVSRYGDFILLEPRVTGLNRLLWFGPPLLLALAAALIYRKIRAWTIQSSTPAEIPPLSEEEQKRVDDALKSFQSGGNRS